VLTVGPMFFGRYTIAPKAFGGQIWSGWDGVVTAAVTLVGPIAYFTRAVGQHQIFAVLASPISLSHYIGR
jgi:hypothetical protein